QRPRGRTESSLRGPSRWPMGGAAHFQWGSAAYQGPRTEDRVDAPPTSPAAGLGGQQQPVSGFAGAPTLSQSGLASAGAGAQAAERRLASALGPSGGLGGELRG